MFGLDDKDIVFNKNELFKEEKKVFIGDLVINSKDLKNDINIPSDAIYGNLIIEGEGQLENIYLPKFVYGDFLLKGFHSLKNIIFPIDIKGEKKFIDVNSLDNITFSSNYSLKDSFRSVRYIKNIIFPSSTNLGFDFMSLKELENVVLPKEVFYLFIPLVTSLKDVVLPLKVIDCLVIRDFRVLDGAIVKEDTNNYQIVTSSGRFNLFDILEHVSYNQDGLGKKLTVTNKYDII